MAKPVLPLLLKANAGWLGNDGNWSTFSIGVGTPNQFFNVVPSTGAGEVWVPLPQGCSSAITNCTASRGVVSSQTGGFQTNESSTWSPIGTSIYDTGFEDNLYGANVNNGLYGQDDVSVDNATYTLPRQTVAGIASEYFWLGILGLGVQASQFGNTQTTTILSSLKDMNLISSLSYGYAVGAHYRSSPGSLVIGGYDETAFGAGNISLPISYAGSRSLTVNLQSILGVNTLEGSLTMPIDAGGLNMSIDSTVAQMWLPPAVCDKIAGSLGLTYDTSTDLYLVNATSRSQLLQSMPAFTFTLAVNTNATETINIQIPWTALDFTYGQPMYAQSTPYFPMRRAANESQYVLGRAFLQEAYMYVDWERMSFTIGQASHATGTSGNIVPVLPPSASSSPGGGNVPVKLNGPGAGVFAGIAIGVIAVVVIACGAGWFFWRQRQRRNQQRQRLQQSQQLPPAEVLPVDYFQADQDSKKPQDMVQEMPGSPPPPGYKEMPSPKPDVVHDPIHELHGTMRQQLMSTPVYELAGGDAGHELGSHHEEEKSVWAADDIESSSRAP